MQPGLGNKNESAVYHPQTSGHNRDNKSEMKHHGSGLKIEQLTNFTNKNLITIETQPASIGVVALEPFDSRS